MPRLYPAPILVIIPINNIVTAFDAPVAPIDFQNPFWIGLIGCPAGNAIGDILGVLAVFLVREFALDDKRLRDVRKVQIALEFGCGPDFSDLDSPMLTSVVIDVIRLLAVLEVKLDVLENAGLLFLNRKMVMPMSRNDVFPDFHLGQHDVPGDVLSLNIDGFQKRNRRFDFVGLFDFVAVSYRQGAHFFGCSRPLSGVRRRS